MKKAISSVQLNIARFWFEISERRNDKNVLSDWCVKFGRDLVMQNTGDDSDEFAKELISEVENFKKDSSDLRKAYRDNEKLRKEITALKKEIQSFKKENLKDVPL